MFTLYELSPVYEFANMGSLRMLFCDIPPSTEVVRWCFHSWNSQHSASCPVRKVTAWVCFYWTQSVAYRSCNNFISAVRILKISDQIEQLLEYSIRFETSTIIRNFRILTVANFLLI